MTCARLFVDAVHPLRPKEERLPLLFVKITSVTKTSRP